MVSTRRLVAFVVVISSVVLLAVFDGLLRSLSLFVVCIFLKLVAVFVGRHRSFSLLRSVVFSLFLSAISEAFCRLSWKLFVVFVGCLVSWKLLAVFVSCLGSFSQLSLAILEASVCRSCCFVVGRFLAALASRSCCFLAFFFAVFLAVLVACSSHSFLAKTFSGSPFLFGILVNIESSASSKRTVKRYVYSMLIVQYKYAPTTGWYRNVFMSPTVYNVKGFVFFEVTPSSSTVKVSLNSINK